ncbi:hypothetical protein GM921_03915 [Pedobacter sp. LMG 31464]|uniref:DUF4369 domain-containing protein n=1 Tax=Pedobacter planticolens TaxID=2679964 RepID=A0A923DVD2_9SPHI|nr:hypothetical protein [Pedobacter planticolens]MBB2144617.1 hypothetical protein [Pedobacter planticolens]
MGNTINKILLLLVLVCLSLSSFAAEPAFIVFYNSGKAVKTVSGKSIILKKGDNLLSTDQINIPEQTQLVLVCANFSVVQLKTKGIYTIKTLLAKCSKETTSASSAYFKYIWHSFSHAHTAPEKDPRAYMQTYGAASRGRGTLITKLNADTINYYNGSLSIGWLPTKAVKTEVYSAATDGDLLITGKPATYIKIDSIAAQLKKSGSYFWEMQGQQNPKRKYLKLWTKASYQTAITKILKGVVATSSAEKAYLTGFMLEERHFLGEASKYYQKALQLESNNQIYKSAFARFTP